MSSNDSFQQAYQQMQESLKKGSLRRDLQGRRGADNQQRKFAEREIEYDDQGRKIPRPMFLRPEDIAKGKDYDVEKVLFTTLGQQKGDRPRRITRDDILAFQDNILLLKDQYKKGITIQNIVNLSLQDDIDRANEQIYLAVPLSRKSGLVHFLTNAGPNSKAQNHHVEVEFSNFNSVVFDIKKEAIATVKNRIANGKIKFECDCERHTFWFRYMATIGGYGLGRQEGGFPKVRNPHLSGVACKHVLRVVHWILSPAGIQYLKKQVEVERTKQVGARYKQSDAKVKDQLNQQMADLESGKAKPITPNIQKAEQEMIRRANKVAKKYFADQLKQMKQAELDLRKASIQAQLNAVLHTFNKDQQREINKTVDSWVKGKMSDFSFDIFMRGLNVK
ncbi:MULTISPECIES: hypothetical protein [unclassified Acinetobacter]|uniref:hypothetical protein n=1 Tax=unclassified Acinetobacter TaxID=196816 RepID=UPI00244B61DC|nr:MULTISPECIES: hypothetical protein [unclassified Acinetobacter]MDH0032583.1 hypothetical protein [Acinetobacter sp. GD04021]MDH0885274.1 hypothetical protein [Acinetobacter sp. GD03873]MDH1084398.1 hypothetical protein [Acinetobacter sp. GD03983]MDH2188286.1 hypothetical protein [Acinetobacter sp. GD03645]MDH2203797.1 hypothetical protein [Acinetobacter sp. GD03647]